MFILKNCCHFIMYFADILISMKYYAKAGHFNNIQTYIYNLVDFKGIIRAPQKWGFLKWSGKKHIFRLIN